MGPVPVLLLYDLVDDHRALADMVRYVHMVHASLVGRVAEKACREPCGAVVLGFPVGVDTINACQKGPR